MDYLTKSMVCTDANGQAYFTLSLEHMCDPAIPQDPMGMLWVVGILIAFFAYRSLSSIFRRRR